MQNSKLIMSVIQKHFTKKLIFKDRVNVLIEYDCCLSNLNLNIFVFFILNFLNKKLFKSVLFKKIKSC